MWVEGLDVPRAVSIGGWWVGVVWLVVEGLVVGHVLEDMEGVQD